MLCCRLRSGEAGLAGRASWVPVRAGDEPVALDDEIDADAQLPDELRGHQHLGRAVGRNDAQDTRNPTMLTSGPPTSPNRAKRGGTKPDRYISHPR